MKIYYIERHDMKFKFMETVEVTNRVKDVVMFPIDKAYVQLDVWDFHVYTICESSVDGDGGYVVEMFNISKEYKTKDSIDSSEIVDAIDECDVYDCQEARSLDSAIELVMG